MEKYTNVAGGSPSDLNIPLVVKAKYENGDYVSIIFKKPHGLIFDSGNWMDIRFLTPDLATGKTYSFASSPTEPDIMIGLRKGVSKFKKALEQLKSGDIILITQYGSNGFLFNKRFSSVFIAGGIGITPFRSMIKYAIDTDSKTDIHLIFQNHIYDFPYKDEFEKWASEYSNLKITYVATEKEGRLTNQKLTQLIPEITDKMYYIAGSPGMVNGTAHKLHELNVKNDNIKTDSFDGY